MKRNYDKQRLDLLHDKPYPRQFTVGKGEQEYAVMAYGKRWVVIIPYEGVSEKLFNSPETAVKFIEKHMKQTSSQTGTKPRKKRG